MTGRYKNPPRERETADRRFRREMLDARRALKTLQIEAHALLREEQTVRARAVGLGWGPRRWILNAKANRLNRQAADVLRQVIAGRKALANGETPKGLHS